jgi:heterodisulfide reductase subunit B
MKQYVILGHSSISKKNLENLKMTQLPNRMKLVMPAKCGQSITSNKETAKMFARGENVRNRVNILLGAQKN